MGELSLLGDKHLNRHSSASMRQTLRGRSCDRRLRMVESIRLTRETLTIALTSARSAAVRFMSDAYAAASCSKTAKTSSSCVLA
jgi:hypothetical protein